MSNQYPCASCAYMPGSDANLEPNNNIKAQVCALSGLPFYCHHDQDWQAPDADRRRTALEMRSEGIQICAGWKREVGDLATTGWFKERRQMRKVFGQLALGALQIFISKNIDDEDKEEAYGQLQRIFKRLLDERNKFLSGDSNDQEFDEGEKENTKQ